MKTNTKAWWEEKGKNYFEKKDMRVRGDEYSAVISKSKSPILEIGSAFGSFVDFLPPKWGYAGVEISEFMVEKARNRYQRKIFINGDIRKFYKSMKGSFKTVVALQVLEHFKNPIGIASMLLEIAPRLVLSVPKQGYHKGHFENDGHISWWSSEDDFIEDFSKIGKVEMFKGAENHYCAVVTI